MSKDRNWVSGYQYAIRNARSSFVGRVKTLRTGSKTEQNSAEPGGGHDYRSCIAADEQIPIPFFDTEEYVLHVNRVQCFTQYSWCQSILKNTRLTSTY